MVRSSRTARRTQGLLGGRSEQVVRQVLDAALVEVARSGYTAFRMDQVAAEARVNKTTIYRRWPNRRALITAVVARMRAPLRDSPLPDTGRLETDLLAAFARRSTYARRVEGQAWARLVDDRKNPEVEAIIGPAVHQRRDEWRDMITRAVARGELPKGTDAKLLLEMVRVLVDSGSASRQAATWLSIAVRTVLAGARQGTLTTASARKSQRARRGSVK